MESFRILILLLTLIIGISRSEYIPPGPKYRCPKQELLLHPCLCHNETDVGVEITCENTNLASMSVGLNNLATFQLPIEKLLINKCHIGRLFGSLLYKLKVRVLEIVDTPIEKIEDHSFLGVNETLNELHIINSSLSEYPKLAFSILGNLTLLKIQSHKVGELKKDAFSESLLQNKLLKFHFTNGNLSSLPIEALQPLRKLKTLDLHGNSLKDLKRNQFKGLRDVEVLDLSHNSITKLDGSHLADLTKLGWCNMSHNQLTELTRGAFARNSVLKWLSLSHNKIKKLDTNSFKGMRFLRRVYMSDNQISDVGRGTFAATTRIGTIDLARNLLKKIDYQMFHQLNFIEIIDVSENNVTEIEKLAFKDLFLTNINLSHNAISKIETGAFINCANMTRLDLSYNNLRNLSKRTFDDTTYATELDVSYNFFTELNQIPLQNMTGLKILNASHNEIIKIPRHTFPKLYELHTIDLSYNNISDIFNSVFQVLFSLRTLDLSHNNLQSIKPSTFGPLPTLLELDLSYNGLKDMAKGALTRLASMRILKMSNNNLDTLFILPISVSHLYLSHNNFKEIPPKLWPSMNSLLKLDLSWNKLDDGLVKGSLENLLTLQTLNLNYNGIREVPWDALSDLSSLQYLYMEGNNLTKLRRAAFGRLPVVFELNLAHNKLNNLTARAFEGLLQLIVLNMTHNNISNIPAETLQGLVSLKTLDLSYNHIERIDNKSHSLLEDCLSLEKLDLSHNKISFISRKMFPSNPYVPYKLKEINLSHNSMPVITYDLVFGTSKVEKLNLSHNSIADIRNYVLGNLTKLQTLDLSYNNLEDVSKEKFAFNLPKNLSELFLSNNRLSELPWRNLHNVTRLRILDISHNHFNEFDLNLTNLVRNKTKVIFQGNPLNCDCFTRPFLRYIKTQLVLDENYKSIKCLGPPYLKNTLVHETSEERLFCPINVNTTKIIEEQPEEYGVTPDIKIRELKVKKSRLKVKWLVVKKEDIADTRVIIQDTQDPQKLLYEETLPYFKRSLEIDIGKEVGKLNSTDFNRFQLCILAVDSKTSVRTFYAQQCSEFATSRGASTKGTISVIINLFIVVLIKSI